MFFDWLGVALQLMASVLSSSDISRALLVMTSENVSELVQGALPVDLADHRGGEDS